MANLKQLKMILTLREEAQNKAAKMMQQAQQALQQHDQQQLTLRQYRNDYLSKMTEEGQTGLSALNYAYYQDFVTRLDEALVRAGQQVAMAKQIVKQRQQGWQQTRTESQAIQTLIDKALAAQASLALRQEQKQLDEFTNARYKRPTLR